MSPLPARSTTRSSQRGSLGQRGADYFGMPGQMEFIAAAGLFGLMVVLKIVSMTRYRFDSDESQHMHVIWAWARGFVQYRDVFDNHMPLFQIIFAPIFGLLGDRPTILYWMRFILLPMYFVSAWCTYEIGTRLFSRRAGVWAVILLGFYPSYQFLSFEFRTDNLWAPLWLLCIMVLVDGAMSVRRALAAGLLLGFCFGVSMKSVLLLLSILVSAPLALFLVGRKRLGRSWGDLAQCGAAFIGSAALVPAIIMIAFALKGIWPEFRYCVFEHNVLAHLNARNHPAWRIVIFPIAFPFVIYAARLIVRAVPDPALAFRRGFIFIVCGVYLPGLASFWNLLTRQDYLPYDPLAFVFYSGALLALSNRLTTCELGGSQVLRRAISPAFIALLGFFVSLGTRPFWHNGGKTETNLLRGVLTLTEPGDYIFDCKGETIFRQRCFWPVLESITRERIQRGMIPDTVRQRCIETHACVAVAMRQMPSGARNFVKRNYLPVGDELRVAGVFLKPSSTNSKRMDFDVVIPASYEIIARDNQVTGLLDGTPYQGARFLAPGPHTFESGSKFDNAVLLWAQAADRHFMPCHYLRTSPHS